MTIPVNAPMLRQSECCNEAERRFLEQLNARAKTARWKTDSWSHTSDHVVLGIHYAAYCGKDIRIDFYGDRLLLGGDGTGQYVTDLSPNDPTVVVIDSGTPEEMAERAADWVEAQLKKKLVWSLQAGWHHK